MPRLEVFFYVDSDLIVVREAFFHSLQLRAQAHDWLPAYGHRIRREKPYDTRNDQSVLSDFFSAITPTGIRYLHDSIAA